MNTHADKTGKNQAQSLANEHAQKQSGGEAALKFIDNRPEAIAQRKLQEVIDHSPQSFQLKALSNISGNAPQEKQTSQLQSSAESNPSEQVQFQKKENKTGLPDQLKAGMEDLSGISLDDVKVHRNSDKPAQLQAHAYAQGTDIHLASGQEKHLAHEAWHVVQQKQGRVKPTIQLKGTVNVNDDTGLESEADAMGAKALQFAPDKPLQFKRVSIYGNNPVLQRVKYAQNKTTNVVYRRDDDTIRSTEKEVERSAYQQYLFDELFKDDSKSFGPTVMGTAAESTAKKPKIEDLTSKLIYRGMSVNNVANREDGAQNSVFTAQNPAGKASAVKHIVDDDPDSPYLSFEANGLDISAGKYAHKPVDAKNQSLGVTTSKGGFLKQEKSYTMDNIDDRYADKKRIGIVAGIFNKPEYLDVSTSIKAKAKLNPSDTKGGAEERAVNLAVADKEILVKPGPDGIAKGDVPFYAKVETISKKEFIDNIDNQTPTMALGYHKPSFYKIQIDIAKSNAKFHFHFKLDDKYQNGGDVIADIPDLKINKGLFSLSTKEQNMVRDEMPAKETALRTISSETDVQLVGLAGEPDLDELKDTVGTDLHDRVTDVSNWFDLFDDSKMNTVKELKDFNTLLQQVIAKSKSLWDQIATLAELPQIETSLIPIETFLKDCVDEKNLQSTLENKVRLSSEAKEKLKLYNTQLKSFNKIKSSKNSHVPQISDIQKKFDLTMNLFKQLSKLIKPAD